MIGEVFSATAIFYDPVKRQVLLQLRDGGAEQNPHKWCLFGGRSESDEEPLECVIREVREELGVLLDPSDIIYLREGVNPRTSRPRYVYLVERYIPPSDIMLGEGADFGWFDMDAASELDLTDFTREELENLVRVKV